MNLRRRYSPLVLLPALIFSLLFTACGGGGGGNSGGYIPKGATQAATPTLTTTDAQGGAKIVKLATATTGAKIYFTLDGTTPTTSSPIYNAPFLVASSATVKAIASASGYTDSNAASQTFVGVPSGTLVWSDEFNGLGGSQQPDATVWTYDTGAGGWGNAELETYCAWGSTTSPCDSANPNAFVGSDGYLHVVARQPSANVFTSARLKTQGLFSITSGRVEALIRLPEGKGLWPAFWMLGNNITNVSWPACGEQDIMEHINAPAPDWIAGSIHGTGLNQSTHYPTSVATSFDASQWHVYGMIWKQGTVQFYVDSPTNIYATYNTSTAGGTWPFDSNGGGFLILNLAVGGTWPGSPDNTTPFPSEMQVDYVRVYTN